MCDEAVTRTGQIVYMTFLGVTYHPVSPLNVVSCVASDAYSDFHQKSLYYFSPNLSITFRDVPCGNTQINRRNEMKTHLLSNSVGVLPALYVIHTKIDKFLPSLEPTGSNQIITIQS